MKEKATTPSSPNPKPDRDSGADEDAIALLLILMVDDSSSRIGRHLRELAGTARPGTRLPSTRSLAQQFGAGPVTVQRAIADLVAHGIVETRPGEGTFVRGRNGGGAPDVSWQTAALGPDWAGHGAIGASLRHLDQHLINLAGGYPDDALLPTATVRSALTRAARSVEGYRRPPVAGLPELRQWFVDELGSEPGASGGWHSADVLIAPGGQAAIAATFRALARPGDAVVMESPTYWGAIGAARQAGLTIVPVPRTDGAPSAADLSAAFDSSGARVFYAQPNFANPGGEQWSQAQQREILDVMAEHRAFLVEDDWAHDLAIDSPVRPLAALDADGHVVYIRSLTKSVSLSMRVAAVLARGPARQRIEARIGHADLFVSPLLQTAALDVVSRAAWRTHLRGLPRLLGERRDALIDRLRGIGLSPTRPAGGLHLWVRLPDYSAVGAPVDPEVVAARTLVDGVAVSPGSEWFPAEQTAPYLRLSYASTPVERYDEAIAILQRCL